MNEPFWDNWWIALYFETALYATFTIHSLGGMI